MFVGHAMEWGMTTTELLESQSRCKDGFLFYEDVAGGSVEVRDT